MLVLSILCSVMPGHHSVATPLCQLPPCLVLSVGGSRRRLGSCLLPVPECDHDHTALFIPAATTVSSSTDHHHPSLLGDSHTNWPASPPQRSEYQLSRAFLQASKFQKLPAFYFCYPSPRGDCPDSYLYETLVFPLCLFSSLIT